MRCHLLCGVEGRWVQRRDQLGNSAAWPVARGPSRPTLHPTPGKGETPQSCCRLQSLPPTVAARRLVSFEVMTDRRGDIQTDRHGNIQTDSRVTMSLVSTLQEKLPGFSHPETRSKQLQSWERADWQTHKWESPRSEEINMWKPLFEVPEVNLSPMFILLLSDMQCCDCWAGRRGNCDNRKGWQWALLTQWCWGPSIYLTSVAPMLAWQYEIGSKEMEEQEVSMPFVRLKVQKRRTTWLLWQCLVRQVRNSEGNERPRLPKFKTEQI